MKLLFKNANAYVAGAFTATDVLVEDGKIAAIQPDMLPAAGVSVIDLKNSCLFPGFIDVHVHFREPGFSYKETIETGSRAAAHGGYTHVCTMPNLNPVPDCPENLALQLEKIRETACIHVTPYGSITRGEKGEALSDMAGMAADVAGFSDDGRGVQSDGMMRAAMLEAKRLGKMIVAHCEVNDLLNGGYIHDGEYARLNGHKGICSESEWGQIKRDLELVRETGCRYHVCHISTKESVELIRAAKKEGLSVTCETAPHYLTMNDMMLQEEGRFKMNPPIRSEADRLALVEGLLDGTIDMIATDHAPHSAEEKGKGLAGSLMGVVGIETAFPVMYTNFVKTGMMSMEQLMKLLHDNAAERFGIGGGIEVGQDADLTAFDLEESYTINPEEFCSKGRSTPLAGNTVFGRCLMTIARGKIAWQTDSIAK